jgi:hypothetical protein
VIKTLLNVSTMSVADLAGRLKEAFEEVSTSLQQDGKMYLTEKEWDARRKKREADKHSDSGARGGGAGKGRRRGRGRGHGGSSSSGSSSKPTGDECQCCSKMGQWAHECRSKPKKEQAHVAQDGEELSLMLASATLIRPEVISSSAEVEIHEEKVFTNLDKEKDSDTGTWVLDTEAINHMSGCRAAFTKIDTAVIGTVRFSDDSVAWIEGCGTVMFVFKNDESRSFDMVYFIPHLMTNIVSVDQLDEIGYKINIDTGMMKIREPGGVLLAKVKREANRLYLFHLKFAQPTCLAVHGHGDEVVWRWYERFGHINMVAL